MDGLVCTFQQNNATPECVVDGTEYYDSWVRAIYLFMYVSALKNSSITRLNPFYIIKLFLVLCAFLVIFVWIKCSLQSFFAYLKKTTQYTNNIHTASHPWDRQS